MWLKICGVYIIVPCYSPVASDQKFDGEVPRDSPARRCVLQELIHWVRLAAIYMDLFHHMHAAAATTDTVCMGKCFNGRGSSRLLSTKLVAWEREYFQSLRVILFRELHKLPIVTIRRASLTCYVRDQHNFPGQLAKVKLLPVDVKRGEF